jgi:hypothetical protein
MPLLRANDGTRLFFTLEQLKRCNVLHYMAENSPSEVIPLENVGGKLLDWLHRFLATHVESVNPDNCHRCHELVDQYDEPLELVRVANYLDIQSLQKYACMRIASVIRLCKSSDDMRRLFNDDVPYVTEYITEMSDAAYCESFTLLVAQVAARVKPIAH